MKYLKNIFLFIIFSTTLYSNTELTVYNKDIGLVKETREIFLKKGIQEYVLKNITSTIIPESVFLKFSSNTKPFIMEQNYEYDLINSFKILYKYINKKITVITKQKKKYSGVLLNYDPTGIVLKTKKEIFIIAKDNISSIKFTELPAGLISKPILRWKLDSPMKANYKVKINYLTKGISWNADYIAKLNSNDNKLDLQAWITMNNNTGLNFKNTKLLLVAGDVNIEDNRFIGKGFVKRGRALSSLEYSHLPSKEKFFEYHLYRIPYKLNIKNKQQKQIKFIEADNIKCKKNYVYEGGDKIKTYIIFKNTKKNNLGIPLPAGKIRMYKNDSKNSLQFIGEKYIKHTAESEKIKLFIGNAFDIIANKKTLKYKKYDDREYGYKYQITVKNRKNKKINVIIREKFSGDWEILNSNFEYKKEDAFTVIWKISIKPKQEKKLVYEYRYSY